jgi:hypothetical protein
VVAQSALAHSPPGDFARGGGGLAPSHAACEPSQMHSSSTSHAMYPHHEPKPAQEPARVSQAPRSVAGFRPVAVPDEPAVKADDVLMETHAGKSLEGNAGMKGKKLQVPPGTML